MKMSKRDIAWLRDHHPNLAFDANAMTITGELDFRACYDKADGNLFVDCDMSGHGDRSDSSRICVGDVFDVEIHLLPQTQGSFPDPLLMQWPLTAEWAPSEYPDREFRDSGMWPSVKEIGGRCADIARRHHVNPADLHLYANGTCCLSIQFAPDPQLRIGRFIRDLIIPFFYRLSFVDTFGLQAARSELWGEYSHGEAGIREYASEMRAFGRLDVRPRDPCPCRRGRRFKDCCATDVRAVTPSPQISRAARLCPAGVSEIIDGAWPTPVGGTGWTLAP